MKISNLKVACEKMVGEFTSHAKLSADEVDELEKEIGYELPKDYREFLMAYGCVETGSEEIIGFGGPKHLNLIAVRNDLLLSTGLNFPDNLCPICADGFGNYDCLQLSPDSDKAAVVYWVHDNSGYIHEKVATSFCVWLDKFCEQAKQ